MNNSEQNGKRKLNIIDYLLILMVAGLLALAVASVTSANPNRISGGDTTVTYKIKCEGLDARVAENIKASDLIYDNNTNQLLGTVTTIETVPITAVDPTRLFEFVDTGKVNVTVTVSAQAWKDNGIYSIDGFDIAAGKTVHFHSAEFSISGLCTDLDPN